MFTYCYILIISLTIKNDFISKENEPNVLHNGPRLWFLWSRFILVFKGLIKLYMFTYKLLLVLQHPTGVYCPDIAFRTKFSHRLLSLSLSLALWTSSTSRQCREFTRSLDLSTHRHLHSSLSISMSWPHRLLQHAHKTTFYPVRKAAEAWSWPLSSVNEYTANINANTCWSILIQITWLHVSTRIMVIFRPGNYTKIKITKAIPCLYCDFNHSLKYA